MVGNSRRRAMLLASLPWLAAMASAMLAGPAWAQQATAMGEVRRVDAQQGTVALRHGEIKDLDLPAATLVYHAAPALLKDIKPGDKVRFTATRQDGKYVVTAIDKTVMP
jgi:Cu(I)/Ag(I) efflux system periplasmic protein CusF